MVSLDAHRSGITVGTMSLIRRAALERAGGWAEWCLTEDSELAIRIHAAGYQSVYLTEPYGRGLIPETFEGYRRQRYRWTYGPVQEFPHHWRLSLTHVITMASLRALIRRPARWQRPDKFRPRRSGLRVLACASSETILGLAGLLAAVGLAAFNRSGGIATALAIGLAVQAITYLTAPV